MSGSRYRHMRGWHSLVLLVLVVAIGLFVCVAFTAHFAGASQVHIGEVNANPLTGAGYLEPADSVGSVTSKPSDPPTPCPVPYHYLMPEVGGPCNGCTVHVGDRFNLDLMVHSNANDLTAQQAYL